MLSPLITLGISLLGPLAQDRPSEVAVDEVLATVEGAPVLASEVDRLFEEAEGRLSRGAIVRQLVVGKVFEAKARAAELTVPDARVDEAMEERVRGAGGPEEYRARIAALGLDFETDRVRVRDALLVDEYVRNVLGQIPGSPLLRPHLARRVFVTPREIQEHYREYRDQYRIEERTEIARLVLPKAAFDDADAAAALARRLRAAASNDPEALAAAAAADPRLRYAEVTLTPAQRSALRAELRETLERTPVGAPGDIVETPGAYLLVLKRSETPDRHLPFQEAQPIVQALLVDRKLREARIALSLELLGEAEVWPEALFPQDVPDEQGVAPDRPPS